MDNDSQYLVETQTLQPAFFKGAFQALKDHIYEANIKIDEEKISILQMDSTHTVCAQLELYGNKFEKYVCKQRLNLGVDIHNLCKLLKGAGNSDILTLFVDDPDNIDSSKTEDQYQKFGIKVENADKGQVSTYYIELKDINDEMIEFPPLDYPYTISLPSADLQSIVNSLKNLGSDTVRIQYSKGNLRFYTEGEIGKLEIVRSKTNKEESSMKVSRAGVDENELDDDSENDEIIEVFVKLSKLVEFTKCSSLSNQVLIYLRTDYPIIVEYSIGSMGFIRYCLAQTNSIN